MAEDAPLELAAYVRTRRLRAGLTQEALAERARLTVDTIGGLERGLRRRLYPSTAGALADALDLSPAERAELALLAHGPSRARRAQPVAGSIQPAASVAQPESVPRAVAGPTHNLPAALTRLIGRERELAQIGEILSHARLLTLIGTGGIGKTSLAIEAARALRARYSDGVWLVELAPLSDPTLVLGAIAVVLGVRESPGRPLIASLIEVLRHRRLLLVLDNCEQVLDAGADIAALLGGCPGLTVLATSRAPLRVRGERELLVPPLRTPLDVGSTAVEVAAFYPAVQLFVERAVAVQADFALTQENAPAVVAICARLDGLPLAIELAAARAKLFTPQALLARLGQRLPVLTGGPQDSPARHRTLRTAIAWSYDLLSQPEQALFRRLGVFVGGFTFAGAAAVCSESAAESVDLLDVVAALVDRSLLQRDEWTDQERERFDGDESAAAPGAAAPAGGRATDRGATAFDTGSGAVPREPFEDEARFAMFETIREFALEQLAVRGEVERWSGGHLAYYLSVLERAEVDLGDTAPVATVWRTRRRLHREMGNFRAALAWALGHSTGEQATRLAGLMCALWAPALNLPVSQRWLDQSAGSLHEAQRWLEQSLALEPAVPDHNRAMALYGLGRVLLFQWDEWERRRATLEYAIRNFRESLALHERLGDGRGSIRCLNDLGWAYYHLDEPEQAAPAFEECLARCRTLDVPAGAGWSLVGLGRIAMARNETERAGPLLEEAVSEQRRAANQLGVAAALDALGLNCQARHDFRRAVQCFEEAVSLRRGVGAESGLAPALQRLGVILSAGGDVKRGVALVRESLVLSQQMGGHPSDTGIGLISLGAMAGSLSMPESGARLFGAGEALIEASGLEVPPAFAGLYRRTVDNVRRALGDQAYAAAFAAGRALPPDQAIAEAMRVAAQATSAPAQS